MSEETTTIEATTETKPAEGEKTFTQADLDRIVADRIARERAKFADYGDLKKKAAAAMTEQEKAVADAEARGRQTALTEFGQELVRAEFRALAGGRVEGLDELLDDMNLAKFLGEDGKPNGEAIAKAVSRFAPPPAEDARKVPGPRPDLSQGSGASNLPLNGDPLLQSVKDKLGID